MANSNPMGAFLISAGIASSIGENENYFKSDAKFRKLNP